MGWILVTVAIIVYLVAIIPTLWVDHENFGTQNFDLGIFDQATYQLSKFEHFMTTRGLNVFGHHVNIGLLFFVPLYWLGLGGAHLLNISAAVSLALAAWPIYAIGLKQIKSVIVAAVVSCVYLLHFSISALIHEGFHPEKMAVPALFLAVWAAMSHRWWLYGVALGYGLVWKEDISLFVLMLGVFVFFAYSRKAGIWTTIVGLSYFIAATRLILPAFNDAGSTFYGSQYGDLGTSGIEVASNALFFKQGEALRLLNKNDAAGYLLDVAQPFGMLSYLSPHWLLLSVPHFAVNLLNIHGLAANPLAHYVAVPVVASTLATIATLSRIKATWLRAALCVWMLFASATTTVTRGYLPVSENFEQGVWQLQETERVTALDEAVAIIPKDAVVMATYDVVPHISHRRSVYMFPNPFEVAYWGIGDVEPPDPDTIEYVALNKASISLNNIVYVQLESSDSFEIIYLSGDVVVFKREAPGI